MNPGRARRWLPWLILLALLVVAAGLRLWRLDALPPGLYGDEAINGVDERMVLSGSGLPVYFTANNGREPIFLYLQAISVAILGPTPLALRLVAALVGILSVLAVYFCARALWEPPLARAGPATPPAFPWAALLAAAGMAVSYWALSLSRLGLRAVMLPLFSALVVAFFWRAWYGGRRRDYLWAGAWLGLSFYTYISARLLPLVPAGVVAFDGLAALRRAVRTPGDRPALRAEWRQRLAGLALLALVAALVLLPLAVTALREPDILGGRADQVSIFSPPSTNAAGQVTGPARRLAQNIALVARNFYDQGDRNPRHNLPGRPANDVLLAGLFTAGWLAALWRLRQPRSRLILLWLAVMLLPTLLSTAAPHSLRAAGALPPLALLYGLGGQTLLGAARRPALRRWLAPALLLAVLVVSGGLTARDYFVRWAALPQLGSAFTTEQQLAAQAAADLLAAGGPAEPVLISRRLYMHPQMTFALGLPAQAPWPSSLNDPGSAVSVRFVLDTGFDPNEPSYLLWRDGDGVQVADAEPWRAEDARRVAQMLNRATGITPVKAAAHQTGWPVLYTGSLPADVQLRPRQIATPLNVSFADGMRLLGYQVTPNWTPAGGPGGEFRLSLFFQVGRQRERGLVLPEAFVHLVNQDGAWQTANNGLPDAYLLPWLSEPRTVEAVYIVLVPRTMPAGSALFETGLYAPVRSAGQTKYERVAILDDAGRPAADRVDLGAVSIGAPPQAGLSDLQPLSATFLDRIELAGWRAARDPGQPDALQVDLAWRVLARSTTDYSAFVHLVDGQGRIVTQQDGPPGGRDNPTTHWVPGGVIQSHFVLQPPPGTQPDGLKLRIGLYEPVSGKQVAVTAGATGPAEGHDTYLILPVSSADVSTH